MADSLDVQAIETASRSDVGRTRSENQDSCGEFLHMAGARLLIVADGMGGHRGGRWASRACVDAFARVFKEQKGTPEEQLREGFKLANDDIYRASVEDAALSGMGTTAVALLFFRGAAWVGWVGDSRAYRWREGVLEQLTDDHALVAEWVRAGLVSPDDARRHPRRSELTRAIGIGPRVEPDVIELDVVPGDRLLLCSDGLSGLVTEDALCDLIGWDEPEHVVELLVERANALGGTDNISVQLACIPEDRSFPKPFELPQVDSAAPAATEAATEADTELAEPEFVEPEPTEPEPAVTEILEATPEDELAEAELVEESDENPLASFADAWDEDDDDEAGGELFAGAGLRGETPPPAPRTREVKIRETRTFHLPSAALGAVVAIALGTLGLVLLSRSDPTPPARVAVPETDDAFGLPPGAADAQFEDELAAAEIAFPDPIFTEPVEPEPTEREPEPEEQAAPAPLPAPEKAQAPSVPSLPEPREARAPAAPAPGDPTASAAPRPPASATTEPAPLPAPPAELPTTAHLELSADVRGFLDAWLAAAAERDFSRYHALGFPDSPGFFRATYGRWEAYRMKEAQVVRRAGDRVYVRALLSYAFEDESGRWRTEDAHHLILSPGPDGLRYEARWK